MTISCSPFLYEIGHNVGFVRYNVFRSVKTIKLIHLGWDTFQVNSLITPLPLSLAFTWKLYKMTLRPQSEITAQFNFSDSLKNTVITVSV